MPPFARSLAASAHGYYLQRLRYNRETDRLVEEALRQESWTSGQWQSWRDERLAYVLDRAARQVPYYRIHWAGRRRGGDRGSWELLENWPILEKDALRRDPAAFIAADAPRKLYLVQTSGTTGTPLLLRQSRETLLKWYALVEARSRRWYGVSRDDRWAILGGRLVTPVEQSRPPFWVWNRGMRQLYLSSYHLSPAWIRHYIDALVRHRITYIWGYTSALYTMAQEILAAGEERLRMKVAITNAEPLYDYQREAISKAFGCPVRETYGMAEMAAAAGECEHGRMHLWPSVGIVEVLENDRPVPAGDTGDLVCTGLLNADMPLIRYRVCDRGVLEPDGARCACARSLPLLRSLEGRMDDVLYTTDGRRIGRLDPVFKGNLPLKELQIVQEALDRVRILYVPAEGFSAVTECQVRDRLQQYMGRLHIEMSAVDRIPRGPSGKFRAVICNLPSVHRNIPAPLHSDISEPQP
jgi:phenylacetate-CoA ligase